MKLRLIGESIVILIIIISVAIFIHLSFEKFMHWLFS